MVFYNEICKSHYQNVTLVIYIAGLGMELLRIVLQQTNTNFIHVTTPEIVGKQNIYINIYIYIYICLVTSLIRKEIYLIFGNMGNYFLLNKFLSTSKTYYIKSLLWYVPCSDKNPRFSSIYRIFSAQL